MDDNHVQYFRINENYRKKPMPTDTYRPREEDIYLRFRQELKHHVRDHLSVADYASLLAITPKYLTSTVRKTSGRPAHKWIEEETILEIRDALEHTQVTVKEIAHQFNFPNISFFCRFFKCHTGLSPNEYRQHIINTLGTDENSMSP